MTSTDTPEFSGNPAFGLLRMGRLALMILAILVTVIDFAPQALATYAPRALWEWPTGTPVAVTRPFDPPAMPWLSGHRGVDLHAPVGSTLVSPAAGTVIFAGTVVDRQVLSILHEGGLRSTYEPIVPLVKAGQVVNVGDPVATVAAGHSPGPLHWGARFEQNQYVNPLRMLLGPSVLKPWN